MLGADVPRYDLFEVTFTSDETFENPFWDPSVWAEFTAPDGRTVRVDGFYFGGKEWKVRFVPGRARAAGRRPRRCRAARRRVRQQGEFNCVKSAKHGFVRVAKKNPARFEYDDGTPCYLIGYQTGGVLQMGHDGPPAGEKWRSVPLAEYLKDFDGAANLNRIQLGCGERRGMGHTVLNGKDGLDRYDLDTCAKLDEGYRLFRQHNVSQILILNQDMSTYGGGMTAWGHTNDLVNYKSVNAREPADAGPLPALRRRALRRVRGHLGALQRGQPRARTTTSRTWRRSSATRTPTTTSSRRTTSAPTSRGARSSARTST